MRQSVVTKSPLQGVLALVILCAVPSMVYAEEAPPSEKTDNKLMLRGGWAYVFGATANVSVGGPVLGIAHTWTSPTLGWGQQPVPSVDVSIVQ